MQLHKNCGCVILREIDFLLKICWSIPCLHPSWKVHTTIWCLFVCRWCLPRILRQTVVSFVTLCANYSCGFQRSGIFYFEKIFLEGFAPSVQLKHSLGSVLFLCFYSVTRPVSMLMLFCTENAVKLPKTATFRRSYTNGHCSSDSLNPSQTNFLWCRF